MARIVVSISEVKNILKKRFNCDDVTIVGVDTTLDTEIITIIDRDGLIPAVKYARENLPNNASLSEAKNYVDKLRDQYGMRN